MIKRKLLLPIFLLTSLVSGGPGFDIRGARLRIGDQIFERKVSLNDRSAAFKAKLQKGNTTLQTWFLEPDDEELFGANFVTTDRLN